MEGIPFRNSMFMEMAGTSYRKILTMVGNTGSLGDMSGPMIKSCELAGWNLELSFEIG